jgi:hypothetical protein
MAIPIKIGKEPVKAPREEMTGSELRALVNPPIPATLDLWLEVPGGDDDRIEDGEIVRLKPGMHFFTAPSTINPGSPA